MDMDVKIYQEVAFEKKNFNAYLSRVLSIESCSKFETIFEMFQGASLGTCSSFIFFVSW